MTQLTRLGVWEVRLVESIMLEVSQGGCVWQWWWEMLTQGALWTTWWGQSRRWYRYWMEWGYCTWRCRHNNWWGGECQNTLRGISWGEEQSATMMVHEQSTMRAKEGGHCTSMGNDDVPEMSHHPFFMPDEQLHDNVERGVPLCWDLHLTYTFGIFPSLITLILSSYTTQTGTSWHRSITSPCQWWPVPQPVPFTSLVIISITILFCFGLITLLYYLAEHRPSSDPYS